MDEENGGPFAGLTVVEFGRFIAAPYCCQLLADGGARVIKVEDVDGDETRRTGPILPGEGRQFLNKNRGKRSLAVDLDHPDVLPLVRRLASTADIVVANFRPGESERLGLSYEDLSGGNPGLIYAENTAFGRVGPLAGVPGMDLALVGYSGLAVFGPDGPRHPGVPVVDYTAALLLAWGISTALYHRERTGRGQRLDVSLLQVALVIQNNQMNHIDIIDDWRHEFVTYLESAFAEGRTWAEILEHRESLQPFALARAYYTFYRTSDGVVAVAAIGRPNQTRFARVLGLDDRWTTEPGWQPEDARGHVDRVLAQATALFLTRSTAAWISLLREAGIPVCPVQFTEQLLDDPQAWDNGYFTRFDHPLVGGATVVGPPVAFGASPLAVREPPPVLGQHTEEILGALGVTRGDLGRLAGEGAIRLGDD